MTETTGSPEYGPLDHVHVGHLPGRCWWCGFHIQTQGHRAGCTPALRGSAPRTAPKTVPPAQLVEAARQNALAASTTRRAQILAYRQAGGPVPPLPGGRDFLDDQGNAVIELILAGVPPGLFDWADGQRNTPARVRARWDAIKPKPQRRTNGRAVLGATDKGMAALADESDILAGTPGGQRNHQLNTSAFNLGQLVASGDLPESVVVAELTAVAREIGLTDREVLGPSGSDGTLHSGLNSGKTTPRDRP